MRVMFDTNMIISAIFSTEGKPSLSIIKAEECGYEICICREIEQEVLRSFGKKWPELLRDVKRYLAESCFTVLPTPITTDNKELHLRDIKDRPIYRAAKNANVDYFITDDKDFLEFSQSDISGITASEFLLMNI